MDVDGRWDSRLRVEARRLPSGATYSTSYAPVRPGSSNGEYSLAYVTVDLPSMPIGDYVVTIQANDGTTRDTAPVVVQVRASCGY